MIVKDDRTTSSLCSVKMILCILLFVISSIMGMFIDDKRKLISILIIWIFIILYGFIIKIEAYFNSILPIILNVILIIRYLLMPMLILIDNGYMESMFRHQKNGDFFVQGSFLFIWEEIFLGVFLCFAYKKWYKERVVFDLKRISTQKNNFVIYIILLTSIMLIILNIKVFTDNYYFIWELLSGEYGVNDFITFSDENASASGIVTTIIFFLIHIVYIILPLVFCEKFYRRYNATKKKIYYFLTLIMCFVPFALIIKHTSRSLIVIPIISGIYIMCLFFPKYKKSTLMLSGGAGASVLLFLTLWKNFSSTLKQGMIVSYSEIIQTFDMYFNGVVNMGKAVAAFEYSGNVWSPNYLVNDVIYSIPLLSKLADETSMGKYWFDKINIYNDLVIPVSGQGLFYFSWIFAPVGVCFMIWACRYMEKRIYISKTLPEVFVYCYAAVMLIYGCFGSITIFFQKLTITVLPLLIVIYINKRIDVKHK